MKMLERVGASLNLTSIDFRGALPRAQAIVTIRGTRFLIFSGEWYENFPVTVADSFACGVRL